MSRYKSEQTTYNSLKKKYVPLCQTGILAEFLDTFSKSLQCCHLLSGLVKTRFFGKSTNKTHITLRKYCIKPVG